MKRVMLIAAVLAMVFLPAAARARYRATPSQHAAIVAAAVAAHDITNAQGPCARVFISSVNRHWASLDFPPKPSTACKRKTANGVALFHKHSGRWHFVTAGSAFTCPIPHVPIRVARDLKVC